jgi:hypothetical protein
LADSEELAKQKLQFEEEQASQRLKLEQEHNQQRLQFEQEQAQAAADRLKIIKEEEEKAAALRAAERARIAAEQKNFEMYAESSANADASGIAVEPFAQPEGEEMPIEPPPNPEDPYVRGGEGPVEPQYEPQPSQDVVDPYEELDAGDRAYADAIAIAERKVHLNLAFL